jgi:alanine dehydrogenase
VQLANLGLKALEVNPALAKGLNVQNHRLVHPAVQEVFPDLVG